MPLARVAVPHGTHAPAEQHVIAAFKKLAPHATIGTITRLDDPLVVSGLACDVYEADLD